MKKLLSLVLAVVALGLAGCTSTNNRPMSHAVFTAAVTVGEQIALSTHPEATPYLRISVPVVCAAANGTNFDAAAIVAALNSAGITNQTARLILNSSLALLNVVVASLGNASTNQAEIKAYAQDVCHGLQAGLPPSVGIAAAKRAKVRKLPPHLE